MIFERYSRFIVITIATLIGVVFSIKWLYPLTIQLVSDGQFIFVPISYGPGTGSDDYFYYSRVRDFIDGQFFTFDPVALEHRFQVTPHSSYQISLIMGSIGGMLTGLTEHAYYFNHFVFPALGFLLGFALARQITGNTALSLLIAFIAIFVGLFYQDGKWLAIPTIIQNELLSGKSDFLWLTQIYRTPNILITNVHILLLSVLLFAHLETKRESLGIVVALIIAVGVSPLISAWNFLFTFAFAGCLGIFYFRDLPLSFASYLKVAIVIIIICLPGLWVLWEGNKQTAEIFSFSIQSIDKIIAFEIDKFKRVLEYIVPPFAVFGACWLAFVFRDKIASYIPFSLPWTSTLARHRFLTALFGASILVFIFVAFRNGTFFAWLTIYRGSEVLLTIGLLSGVVACLSGLCRRLVRLKPFTDWGATVIIIIGLVGIGVNQWVWTEGRYKNFAGKEFSELSRWTVDNTEADKVAVTMDFYLAINLPVYSPLYMYIPQALLSLTPQKERIQRVLETAAFYGMDSHDLREMFSEMKSSDKTGSASSETEVQNRLMQLTLYYGRHYYEPMPVSEIDRLVRQYEAEYLNRPQLSFAHDYLIVSEWDRRWIKQGSQADQILASTPAFTNGKYDIYSISR